ncbi:hypothetical protein ACLOJK_004437, partial [Asimina triloba]
MGKLEECVGNKDPSSWTLEGKVIRLEALGENMEIVMKRELYLLILNPTQKESGQSEFGRGRYDET